MYARKLLKLLNLYKKSALLLGPRQTGKSTLMEQLRPDLSINLMREITYLEFTRNPLELEQRLPDHPASILIDEVQRIPSLLNSVQVIIDQSAEKYRFYLTGSSARKLKRGQANLLPGRIHVYRLGPLTIDELGADFDLKKALQFGTLPGIYSEKNDRTRKKTLMSYASTYLREEIQVEALTRNIEGFSRFINLAALESGNFLDLSKLGDQAAISPQTAKRYFEILEDTLVVYRLNAFSKSNRKRLIKHPKFFFFDIGVANAIAGDFSASPKNLGPAFENFVVTQIIHLAMGCDCDVKLSTYRTNHGAEVDVILEYKNETWAIEVKHSSNVGTSDLRGFESFKEFYQKPHRSIVVYTGEVKKRIRQVELIPLKLFFDQLNDLFNDEL